MISYDQNDSIAVVGSITSHTGDYVGGWRSIVGRERVKVCGRACMREDFTR